MLKVVPLGGLGEFGLNALALDCGEHRLLIDCGAMFPRGEPGVARAIPDLRWLYQAPERLTGVLLTHGHEDHLGALAHLLARIRVPVYGTPFTLALARHRLEEAGLDAELRAIGPGEPVQVGAPFRVEPVRVCHSIPDAVGFLVRTPEGTVLHTGDFKLDPDPPGGWPTDEEALGRAGDEGVLCLLSDSTGAEHEGAVGSEREVIGALERHLAGAPGRIIVSMFASNLVRLQSVLTLAARAGRKVALLGQSLERNLEAGARLGQLQVPPGLLVAPEAARALPPRLVLLLATGSQAEPRSALVQLADPAAAPSGILPGDLVILSARPIPGNEAPVAALTAALYARGARVVYPRIDPGLHVSGHASRPGLRRMIALARPAHFVPLHGELQHLHRHLELAAEAGLPSERRLLLRDGDVLGFSQGAASFLGTVPAGPIWIDRHGGGAIATEAMRERDAMASAGLLVVVAVLDAATGALKRALSLTGRGLSSEEEAALPHAAAEAYAAFLEVPGPMRLDDALAREELTRVVRRAFRSRTQKRPAVLPVIVKV